MTTLLTRILILTLSLITICQSYNLYKSNHPFRKTTELFERLKYHETIKFKHNQFHLIDDVSFPIYPMNGKLEFDAFNRHYTLLIRKNMELFSDSFHTQIHRYNETTKQTEKIIHSTEIPQCYYTAEVISDDTSSSRTEKTRGVFSACQGQGIRGWVHAFGETIVIRPKLHLTDVTYKGKHRIDHEHIVYKYTDLDRSDYPHNQGPTCGHDHPNTEKYLDEEIEKWKDKDPSRLEWIYRQREHLKNHNHSHIHHHHDDDEEEEDQHSEYDEDIIANPFSEHAKEIGENLRKNLKVNSKRRLQSTTTRYVELAIVNDPAMLEEFDNDLELIQEKTISIVATLQDYYLSSDWGSVGTIQIVLSAIFYIESFGSLSQPSLSCDGSATEPSLYDSSPPSDYCEVQYGSYLSNFQNYRSANLKEYDNAQLFSYYDFADSVIGYASLPGMCISGSSGGIEQCTYDDEYNGNIVAHEMGHNFNMQHDSNGNDCDSSSFIMAAVGSPYGNRPNSFSDCSVTYCEEYFDTVSYQSTLKCLDNKPTETSFAVCRNGFVEEGESCDCGESDCSATDPCCDGSTCALYASSDCSNLDDCCEDCSFKSSDTVCRELDEDNTCDIEAETCTGSSAECPPDLKGAEGTQCDDGAGSFGYCYAGSCVSLENQCYEYGLSSGSSSYSAPEVGCGSRDPNWQVDDSDCGNRIRCSNGGSCTQGDDPDDGMPCTYGSSSRPAQCVDEICSLSESIFTYVWTVYAYEECNVTCRSTDDDAPGYQTRVVECTLQNGTAVDESECSDDKPSTGRVCNDYVCDFCAKQPDGLTVCGEFGTCEPELATCDCDPGYAGTYCDTPPALNFTGITSMAYKNTTSGYTISLRANPCATTDPNNSVSEAFDAATSTLTVPVDDVTSLTDLLVGSTVGVRWSSAGDIELLAVGMIEVDPETGDQLDPDAYPFYVGDSLASDDNTCDDNNSTNYDGCLQKLECNDFTFRIGSDVTPGFYKLIIRFNNVFNIHSEVLTISCSDDNCNSAGHGRCNADKTGCECDFGWSGNDCSYSPCDRWAFAVCDVQEDGTCGSTGITDWYPKCFDSGCDASVNATTISADEEIINQCDLTLPDDSLGCNNTHFEGQYCEIPRDYCSTLESEPSCNDNDRCSWDNTNGCLYSNCSVFTNQQDCEDVNINQTYPDASWPEFCYWDSDNGYCNRVTCGGGVLPQCANDAVRRPIFDQFADEPISICHAWYCDCATVKDVSLSSWTVTSTTQLLSAIDTSNYDYTSPDSDPLTEDYIDADSLDLFTCSACGLTCSNGAEVDASCSNCDEGCPIEVDPFRAGPECNQAFWIGSFRLNVDWEAAFIENWDVFEPLMIEDLAYFLSTDTDHISIWQLKPDGDKSIVYFRYLFDTDNDDETQITGGDLMALAKKEIKDSTSSAVRGFIMQYTDSGYSYQFCIPTKEECDPDDRIDIIMIFYICCGSSFGLVLLAVLIYRIATRGKRQRAYEAKVREVRQAQLRLMEHHSKARRVGMRDVSKNRAHKIHKAHRKVEKEQEAEIKRRAEQEKKLNKINEEAASSYKSHNNDFAAAAAADNDVDNPWGPKPVYAASAGHYGGQESQVELENYRRMSAMQNNNNRPEYAASNPGGRRASYQPPGQNNNPKTRAAAASVAVTRTRAASKNKQKDRHSVATRSSVAASSHASSNPGANLPPNWKVYYNNDGIPYYYNTLTGETTWRHPNE